MGERLKVIALISGGKDSIFSILHCIAHGHQIIALANLHPESSTTDKTKTDVDSVRKDQENRVEEPDDIESYMYQTIGHNVIPLYGKALNLPLYRQPIHGQATNTSKSYQPTDMSDETESLIPLLRRVLADHPSANAICTGAILSTYQRTRIESVALRLGLTPLAYLWQYPTLPPYVQSSLLNDMSNVGLDARIIKVASGGLSSDILWRNVANHATIQRLESAVARFRGSDDGTDQGRMDGAVLGEGGEFETLAIDGPDILFRRRIIIDEESVQIRSLDGGSAVARIMQARVVEKESTAAGPMAEPTSSAKSLKSLKKPQLWDDEFLAMSDALVEQEQEDLEDVWQNSHTLEVSNDSSDLQVQSTLMATSRPSLSVKRSNDSRSFYISNIIPSTIAGGFSNAKETNSDIEAQTNNIVSQIEELLSSYGLSSSNMTFATILLRSMSYFSVVNKIYSSMFTDPNPPARATVAIGDRMPEGCDIMISLIVDDGNDEDRKGLHVQSRSYWAPANIGPYSQSIATRLPGSHACKVVHVAGQIPLIPSTMELLESSNFAEHAALGLQHMWRIGREMGLKWWAGGAVAFVDACSRQKVKARAKAVGQIWRRMHAHVTEEEASDSEDEEVDIGNAALYRPWAAHGGHSSRSGIGEKTYRAPLPDWECVKEKTVALDDFVPPCIVAEVAELPRGAQVEWVSFGFEGAGLALYMESSGNTHRCKADGYLIEWKEFKEEQELAEHVQCCAGDGLYKEGLLELYASSKTSASTIERASGMSMIVPCRSVWNCVGEELVAALRWRSWLATEDEDEQGGEDEILLN